jgi:hypothetical protein
MAIDRSVIKPTVSQGLYISPEQLQAAIEKKGPQVGMFRTCLTCMFFVENTEQCAKQRMRPPARVIAYGCGMYENDDVPF